MVIAICALTVGFSTFETSYRPYLAIKTKAVSKDDKALVFEGQLSNAGSVPAERVDLDWAVYVDNVALPRTQTANPADRVLNPKDSMYYRGTITTPAIYQAIMSGSSKLDIYYRFSYHWRYHSQTDCAHDVFDDRVATFIDGGNECDPHPLDKRGEISPR